MKAEKKMDVTLKFLGSLRHSAGRDAISLDCKTEISVLDLLTSLAKNVCDLRRNLLDEQFEIPKPSALILVNGKEISILNGLDTKVKNGDEIVFVPVVHGG
jgi:molybdopterin synthase sulfur carrier subunit